MLEKKTMISDYTSATEQLPPHISVKQLKAYLHCNDNTAYELVKRRDFPSFKIGARYYILVDKFIEWMEKESKKDKS